jgi:hypothetical protein
VLVSVDADVVDDAVSPVDAVDVDAVFSVDVGSSTSDEATGAP